MKGLSLHWTVHPDKVKGLYYDDEGNPRSDWYDQQIVSKLMTPSQVARELDINYEHSVEGLVYKEFRKSHILRGSFVPSSDRQVYRYLDFGRVNACLWSQFDELGRLVFFKELVLSGSGDSEQFKTVASLSAQMERMRFRDFGDPSGLNPNQYTQNTSFTEAQENGIFMTAEASRSCKDRLRQRTELLKKKLAERIGEHEAILIHESCETTIDGFQSGYRYVVNQKGETQDTIEEVHPYEDVIDCVAGTVFELFHMHQGREVPKLSGRKKQRNPYTGY